MELYIFHLGNRSQCPRADRLYRHAIDKFGSESVTLVNEDTRDGPFVHVVQTGIFTKLQNLILLVSRRFECYLKRKYLLLGVDAQPPDIVIAHDLLLLPVVFDVFRLLANQPPTKFSALKEFSNWNRENEELPCSWELCCFSSPSS